MTAAAGAQARLAADLGPACPDTSQLQPEEAEMLLELVQAALRDQRSELERGIEQVLGALPRLIRIPARAIVFGGSHD